MRGTDPLERIERKLNLIDTKLDKHLERISKNETDLSWVRGFIRITTTLVVAALTGMAAAIYEYLSK